MALGHTLSVAASNFCFGYPFAMTWYWITGGLLFGFFRERHDPPSADPPLLPRYPGVSILIPCHNEENHIEETLAALEILEYPDYEIIVINDGSKDGTGPLLNRLASGSPRVRVVHLSSNQGKSTALNAGALAARHEYLVCIDSDALLDRHALTWFMFSFLADEELGALTGNPRIRNRGSLLGQIQVGEFSSIVGLIKRAQSIYGRLFTISGVICAFRKRALQDAGWWTRETITDDVDATWKIQLAGWRVSFASSALCWILMPETLKGLWHQRLRWSQGGTRTLIESTGTMFRRRQWRMVPIWLNYWAGILWAYVMIGGLFIRGVHWMAPALTAGLEGFTLFPQWSGMLLVITYLFQAAVSLALDKRFEADMVDQLFWQIWYPLAYWMLQTWTAVVGLPKALRRPSKRRGVWVSPDRGIA
jgi:biofilm PGA synthesis N-glycosyltransferase PgaC